MSKTHTDSAIVEHHEDGSWTVTTVETHYPATRGEKAAAWTALGALCIAPFTPLIAIGVAEWWDRRREAKAKKDKPDLTVV